jgi:ribosomal protein L3 glutamine methyltransferase
MRARRSASSAPTVGTAFRATVSLLRRARLHYGHGTHDARDEAAFFLLHLLGLPPQPLAPHRRTQLSAAQLKRLQRLVAQRIRSREPAAYLLREAWLGEHRFYVDRRVIVPRSFIAELLRERLEPWLQRPVRRILDLCTGSGCLAILAGYAFPDAGIDASDVSRAARAVAARNVTLHGMQRRVRLVHSDLFAALARRRYDLILCNPPYVTAARMRALPSEYRHEPSRALAGGADGLDVVRRILREAPAHLTQGGALVCEIGHNRPVLERSYPRTPFVWLETSAGPDNVFLLERRDFPATPVEPGRETRARPRRARRRARPRAPRASRG